MKKLNFLHFAHAGIITLTYLFGFSPYTSTAYSQEKNTSTLSSTQIKSIQNNLGKRVMLQEKDILASLINWVLYMRQAVNLTAPPSF